MHKNDSIDTAAIEALSGFLEEIVTAYRTTSPELLERMKVSVTNNDLVGLSASAHSLKSSSALVGATRLSESCAILETAKAIGSEARDRVAEAFSEFEDVVRQLEIIVDERKDEGR